MRTSSPLPRQVARVRAPGLIPQSENTLGGPRMQGRGDGADQLLLTLAVQEAGAFAVVFEMVPPSPRELTQTLSIATIGIGAGPNTDGQVLVWSAAGYPSDAPQAIKARLTRSGAACPPTTVLVRERSFDPRTTRTTDFTTPAGVKHTWKLSPLARRAPLGTLEARTRLADARRA